jgi:hypothetical protein
VKAALRVGSATWNMHGLAPVGTYAGTPTADELGPRRVLVRLEYSDEIQEFEEAGGQWVAVGDRHPVVGMGAPNLTPNGLDMVWSVADANIPSAVYIAHRENRDAWFGDPVPILAGVYFGPQLLDRCSQLFAASSAGDELVVRRYDR